MEGVGTQIKTGIETMLSEENGAGRGGINVWMTKEKSKQQKWIVFSSLIHTLLDGPTKWNIKQSHSYSSIWAYKVKHKTKFHSYSATIKQSHSYSKIGAYKVRHKTDNKSKKCYDTQADNKFYSLSGKEKRILVALKGETITSVKNSCRIWIYRVHNFIAEISFRSGKRLTK